MGASAFSGKYPPNSKADGGDMIPACGTGIETSADANIMPCREDKDSANTWASARSYHNQGVNASRGDGSVAFIADDIAPDVWRAMCTAAGEETVTN
jgi:hypothetical protein